MNKLSKEMLLKMIETIDKKLFLVIVDYEKRLINHDEFFITSKELTELQNKIKSRIEIEETQTEEQFCLIYLKTIKTQFKSIL